MRAMMVRAMAAVTLAAGGASVAQAASVDPGDATTLRYGWGAYVAFPSDLEHTFYFTGSFELPSADSLQSIGTFTIDFAEGQAPVVTSELGITFVNSELYLGEEALSPKYPSNSYYIPDFTGTFTVTMDAYSRIYEATLDSDVLDISNNTYLFPDGTAGSLLWNSFIFADEEILYAAGYYVGDLSYVPLPASAMMLLCGLGSLCVFRRSLVSPT